jgi:hypothetical protein
VDVAAHRQGKLRAAGVAAVAVQLPRQLEQSS